MSDDELIRKINEIELIVPNRNLDYVDGYVNGFEVARNKIIDLIKELKA